ncbi:protocadherin Fat 4-like isoform X2 [Mya arenaria]|uniref:protocadherin Fat 4-like isoform X2 n=1 Tax=Mya arenaria TaxID=6604 RepID=UPI0022DEC19F|nr:protocadherin Fat 4-like isoform X2 [Mya arenaria]
MLWTLLLLSFTRAERAGIQQCSSEVFGPSGPSSGGTASTNESYLMQDALFQFTCCGVLKEVVFMGNPTAGLNLQIWRQNGSAEFQLISSNIYTTPSPVTPDDDKKVSFREGDLIGWSGSGVEYVTDTTVYLNWYSGSAVSTTHAWYGEDVEPNRLFQVKVTAEQSTIPYFRNLPTKLQLRDTEVQTGGVTLMTLSFNDLDPDDNDGITVTMAPEWSDLFELTASDVVQTKASLAVDTEYLVVFRVEEAHCGLTASSTLTVIVTDSVPYITNLPSWTTLHEDAEDETLLYTVTMSDPTDQPMWCKGDWSNIGQPPSDTPFIVKMISTAAGYSRAGIYLIEDPKLDFTEKSTYTLTIKCYDTNKNEATGTFYVNVLENREPIFTNLDNMVEIDATLSIIGDTIFTISTTDDENDQRTFGSVSPSCDKSSCPFAIFDSGEVRVTDRLLTFLVDSPYTLTIAATDRRATITERKLKIYIKNNNTKPKFSNAGVMIDVNENSALGKSVYQLSATDDDGDTLSYYWSIQQSVGYQLFEISSSGEITTHSSNNIDFDVLTSTTLLLNVEIIVYDTKEQATDTLTINIVNVNEAPTFIQKYYMLTGKEGAAGTFSEAPVVSAVDPDDSDTLTYSMDCGSYSSYLTIAADATTVSFLSEYDLDDAAANLPTLLVCSLVVKDASDYNDTASIYITIEYDNDNSPVFDPASYQITVRSDTPLGFMVLMVTATDADRGDDIPLKMTLDQSHLGGTYFVIDTDGSIHANQNLTDTKELGTKTIEVQAEDPGGNTATADIIMTFVDASVTPVVVDDRDRTFIEDYRNVWWVSLCVVTLTGCVFLLLCMAARRYLRRTQPLIDINKFFIKFKRERKPEPETFKKKKYGGQKQPTYRHIHSNEILVASPTPVETTDNLSMRVNSAQSGRISVSDVKVKEDKTKKKVKTEPSWMDGTSTPSAAKAPVKSIAHARLEDWEYLNPHRSTKPGNTSVPYTPSEYIASSKNAGNGGTKPTTGEGNSNGKKSLMKSRVRVSPSPGPLDHTMDLNDDNDFRSKRLSMTSPSADEVQKRH